MRMNVRTTGFLLRPAKIAGTLAVAATLLWLGSFIGQILQHKFGVNHSFGLIVQLNVDGETNIAAWFSSALLLLCAVVLWVISRQENARRESRLWLGLAIIFMLLSMDEASELHELTMNTLREHFYTGGYLFFPWVILAVPFVFVLFLAYLPFLRRLRATSRNLFLISGALYVGGAVGMEMIGAKYADMYRPHDFTFTMLAHVEEAMEMAGSILFLYALLEYLSARTAPLQVHVLPVQHESRMTMVSTTLPDLNSLTADLPAAATGSAPSTRPPRVRAEAHSSV